MKTAILSALFFTLLVSTHCYSCCDANTLAIQGAATVQVAPDLATFTVSASGYGATSLAALSNLNKLITQASAVLQGAGLPTSNYTTSSINLYPQYNYTDSLTILIGQQASQSLQVTVGNLNLNKNKLGQLATSLAAINNLTVSGFSFQNSNTTAAYRQARLAAVSDAKSKATQYVALSNRRLGNVRKVVDQNSENYVPFVLSANEYSFRAQTLNVPYGQVQVSSNVEVDWFILNWFDSFILEINSFSILWISIIDMTLKHIVLCLAVLAIM